MGRNFRQRENGKMKFKKSVFYTIWSAAIILCVCISFFALIFASCSKGGERPANETDKLPAETGGLPVETDVLPVETQTPTEPKTTQPADVTPAALLTETPDAGTEYQDKFVFLGDSTTYGIMYYGVLSGGKNTTQVWTPKSGTLALFNQSIATIVYPETGEEILIADAAEKKQPEYMLITLGVNGVASMDEEYFKSEYSKLIQSILTASPNTKIILNTIYPVASNYDVSSGIDNTKIVEANKWIEAIAEENNVRFLNSYEVIVDGDGYMKTEYNSDGLHMNADGYSKVLEYLRTHEYK